jgi:hypothetical protein
MRNVFRAGFLAIAALLAGAGCSTYKKQVENMNSAWRSGQPAAAARQFGSKAAAKNGTKDAVIWHLEAGAAYRAIGDFTNSNRHLDAAIAKMDQYEQSARVHLGQEAGAILSNQQNLPYEGKAYDKIMAHTYRALNYLALGEVDKAGPELIRAYQCQQDAVAENARRIEKSKAAADQAAEKANVDRAMADPTVAAALNDALKPIEGFKLYADYVNPFTVAGDNPYVQQDMLTVSNVLAGLPPEPCTYVLFETGEAVSLDQERIDIPIIVANVSYVGIAFPKLEFHYGEAPTLQITAGAVQATTVPLASMDAVIALDFKNEFPVIITKTMISTISKVVAAYAVNEAAGHGNEWAWWLSKLGTAIAQAAVNIADTRSWTTLPKQFQVARLPTPASRQLTLSTPGGVPVEVNLLDGRLNVLYVKSINAGSPLLVNQFKFK